MHPLEKKITALVLGKKLISPNSSVLLAISGGPDSMAMLHLLAAGRQELPCTLTAVYVDHGLRSDREIEKEKQLVKAQASLLGISAHVREAAVRDHAGRHKLSIEDAGRRLRYAILHEIAARQGANAIAVAHTADDQAEEVLLRLLRGTGRMGLSGMRLRRDDNGVIRPLLLTTKQELLAYLEDKKIPFATDSSNADLKFLRNRIRQHLLPLLEKEYNPNIGQALRNTAAILQEEEAFIERHAATAYHDCLGNEAAGKRLSTASLNRQHLAIQRRVIEKMLWSLEVAPSFSTVEGIRNLSRNPSSGGELHLAGGLRVIRGEETLLFDYPKGRTPWRGSALQQDDSQESEWQYSIAQPGPLTIEEIGLVVNLTVTESLPPAALPNEPDDFLDLDTVRFPLICRSIRRGDRFQPLGAPGSKKVADYLRDRKIPRQKRRRIPVLESNGRIIALPGVNIAHHCRVRETTRRLLRISID